MILEACVGNLNDALSAQSKGAHQIELCDRLDLDGKSPSLEMIKAVTSALNIPVKAIVNPKPFDYSYTSDELVEIKDYITSISKLKIGGIVFGPVDQDGMPDLNAIKLISRYTDLPITFHKAIDDSPDIHSAIESLVKQGIVKYILTSGGEKTAERGVKTIDSMHNIINQSGSEIQLIAAGKITNDNLSNLHNSLGLNYYHGKLIVGQL